MDIVVAGLFLIVCLKAWEIGAAIRWLGRMGEQFRGFLATETNWVRDGSGLDGFDRAAQRAGGEFAPLGYKDLRIRRRAQTSRGHATRRDRVRARCAHYFLWGFNSGHLTYMAVAVCVSATILNSALGVHVFVTGEKAAGWLIYALCMGLLLCVLLLATEAIFSFAILGGYGSRFHKKDVARSVGGSAFLLELSGFARTSLRVIAVGTAGVFACGALLRSFAGLRPLMHASLGHILSELVTSAYFVLSTFSTVGYGDIHARSTEGKIFVMAIMVSTFVVVGLLLTALTLSISSTRPTAMLDEHRVKPPSGAIADGEMETAP